MNVVAGTGYATRLRRSRSPRPWGLEPVWEDGEAWTGQLAGDRARRWGWTPQMGLDDARPKGKAGLRAERDDLARDADADHG